MDFRFFLNEEFATAIWAFHRRSFAALGDDEDATAFAAYFKGHRGESKKGARSGALLRSSVQRHRPVVNRIPMMCGGLYFHSRLQTDTRISC